jgi:lysyl-tRNA synthetase class 2
MVRGFLEGRGYLEVDVPIMGAFGLHHPGSPPVEIIGLADTGHRLFLQTSPEVPLKRLLAAGFGPVFAISRTVRRDPPDSSHNCEFSLLEWYQPDLTLEGLLQEVDQLFTLVGLTPFRRVSFGDLALEATGLRVHEASLEQLDSVVNAGKVSGINSTVQSDRRQLLQQLLDDVLVPRLRGRGNVVLTDYPPELACFAAVDRGRTSPVSPAGLARRFEAFADGLELANGCEELTDPSEYLSRMRDEWKQSQTSPREIFVDEYLLAAARAGIPKSAGVGVGLDRLVMAATRSEGIHAVVAFPTERA